MEEGTQHEAGYGQPYQGGVRAGIVACKRIRCDLEYRFPVQMDGGSAAFCQWHYRVVPAQPEVLVDSVRIVIVHLVDDLESGDDFPCPQGLGFDQVPFGAVVHERDFFRHFGKRRSDVLTRPGESLEDHPAADVVVLDRELVAPGLEGIVDVPVNHHILRQVVAPHPLLPVGI